MSKPLALLTRPREESLKLANELKTIGWDSVISPMIRIQSLQRRQTELKEMMRPSFAGWIVTSARAVPEFMHLRPKEDLSPIYVIGHKTAEAFVREGIQPDYIAENNSRSLMRTLTAHGPEGGEFIHICGTHISQAFQSEQQHHRGTILSFPVYDAIAEEAFDPEAVKALSKADIKAVLFYSARTARIFDHLIEKNHLRSCLSATQALCLAPSVVNSLRNQDWGGVIKAERLDTAAMLDLVRSLT